MRTVSEKFLIAVLFVIIMVGGFFFFRQFLRQKEASPVSYMAERVTLTTSDGKTIIGDYFGKSGEPAVLLLHMMPATRESWRAFSEKLNAAGFQTLAIDLRGHGESQGGPDGYRKFPDEVHQSSIHDVEAGVKLLKSKGAPRIFIAGASIGANLALWYAAEHKEIDGVILLSPGFNYRGLKTESYVSGLKGSQGVYLAASRDDSYSAETVEGLFAKTPLGVKKEFKMFERAGHGTTMFEKEPAFMDELTSWLRAI